MSWNVDDLERRLHALENWVKWIALCILFLLIDKCRSW